MNDLVVLHMSDLHCRDHERAEFRLRRDALFRDLRGMHVKPNLLLVSGDVAFSGQPQEYRIALEDFFGPVMEELRLTPECVFVSPGNHDIARNMIDEFVRDGILAKLTDTETVQPLLGHETWVLPQQGPYLDFLERLHGERRTTPYHCRRLVVDRARIGIAVLDSAWLCLDDNTERRVFLTRRQVQETSESLEDCDLRIAMFHHPLSWFHPSEQDIVQQDLRSHFDILLVGHKHEAESRATTTPSTDCLDLMAASFFDGHPAGAPDGYNLYSVNALNRKLHARYRAFYRQREAYDHNVVHAPGGEFEFPLPSSAYANVVSTALARRVTEVTTALRRRAADGLRRAQQLDDPILLVPAVDQMTWKDGEKVLTRVDDPVSLAMCSDCVVYAPPDAGSTTYLEEIHQRINGDRSRMAVYVDAAEIGAVESPEDLMKRLIKVTGYSEAELSSVALTLVIDHFEGADPETSALLLASAREFAAVILCLKNQVLFDTLAGILAQDEVAFLRMRYWGPSRLRQFTKRYIEAVGLPTDADAAYKFISDSLSLSDLPVSPFLVALYLRVFLEFGGELTGISFVRLLERLEEDSLDRADSASSYSIYNLRLMLMKLASRCHSDGMLAVPRASYEETIATYFEERDLTVDPARFIDLLVESGILAIDDADCVAFSCIVFFNYYLSKSIEAEETSLDEHLQGLHTALRLGDALAYYAGRNREEERLAQELMRCLEEEYSPRDGVDGEYLDKYIHHLLSPEHKDDSKDEVAQEAIDASVDYTEEDRRFEKDQTNYRSLARTLMTATPPKDKVEKVAWNIMALKTFYNVFRNLEHIPADSKLVLLDRILDFHLHCNMDLIDLFTEAMEDDQLASLCAYMITMGGEVFLSRNVGSAALEKTVNRLLGQTTNDFKSFLLHCIYADLHLPNYASRLDAFICDSSSVAIVEMGYAKVYSLLVHYEGDNLPTSLISAFNSIFEKRQGLYGRVSPLDLQRSRDKALNSAKRQHLVTNKDKKAK